MSLYSLFKKGMETGAGAPVNTKVGKQKHNTRENNPKKTDNKKLVRNKYTKTSLIFHLKEMLDEKYALEQTMARLTGGKTGVVELKSHISWMWDSGDLDGAKLYESMFRKKTIEIAKSYKRIQAIQGEAENIKRQRKKDSITQDEAELYDLIQHIQYDDFYKDLIEKNDNFLKEMNNFT